ncbi:hypothetical protein KY320_01070, partial [Candidatus Woesearchaeota archaeon]|nr:hypothetical protein [Candidatus Woesearchaeota archaeon]
KGKEEKDKSAGKSQMTVDINIVESAIKDLREALDKNDLKFASKIYGALRLQYAGLPKEDKAKVHAEAIELQKRLVTTAMFTKGV